MKPAKNIILCATQRSGSTLLSQDMTNTGKLGLPREYFIIFATGRRERLGAKLWRGRLATIMENRTENGVFCAKVMASQVPFINQRLIDGTRTFSENNVYDAFHRRFKDAVWVFLKRENTIKQAISRSMLNQSLLAHAERKDTDGPQWREGNPEYSEDYNSGVVYQEPMLKHLVSRISAENLFWEIFFAEKGIKPIRISYESYCQDPQFYLSRIGDAIGETVTFQEDKRSLVKLANQKNAEFFKAFSASHLSEFRDTLHKELVVRQAEAAAQQQDEK